jgi:DNA-binding NarL/FixJ family response regulator
MTSPSCELADLEEQCGLQSERVEVPPMTNPATVLLIDPEELVRRGIRQLLETQPQFRVIADASERNEAVAVASAERPDLIVLDPETEEGFSFSIIEDLVDVSPTSRILILTATRDPSLCTRSMMMGAVGIVSKHQPAEVLFTALGKLRDGQVWLDRIRTADVLNRLARRRREHDSVDPKVRTLTRREREIVNCVCEGLRNKALGERLFISEATVRNHLTSILDKLQLSSRLDLVLFAFRHRLVEPPVSVLE